MKGTGLPHTRKAEGNLGLDLGGSRVTSGSLLLFFRAIYCLVLLPSPAYSFCSCRIQPYWPEMNEMSPAILGHCTNHKPQSVPYQHPNFGTWEIPHVVTTSHAILKLHSPAFPAHRDSAISSLSSDFHNQQPPPSKHLCFLTSCIV
jgi:hypothetical protein